MKQFALIIFSLYLGLSAVGGSSISPEEIEPMLKKASETLSLADFARDHHSYRLARALYSDALKLFREIPTNTASISQDVLKFKIVYCESQLEAIRSLVLREEQKASDDKRPGTETYPVENPVSTTAPSESVSTPSSSTNTGVSSASRINIDTSLSKVSALIASNQPAEAREILMSVLKANPDRVDARMLLVIAQCATKRFDDAYYIADALVEEMPRNPLCHILKATALFGQGNLEQAEVSLLKAIEIEPRCGEAHFNLAQLFLEMNPPDFDKARYHYMKAISLGVSRDEKLEERLKQRSSTVP